MGEHPGVTRARNKGKRDLAAGIEAERELIRKYLEVQVRSEIEQKLKALIDNVVAGLLSDKKVRSIIAQNYARQEMLRCLPGGNR